MDTQNDPLSKLQGLPEKYGATLVIDPDIVSGYDNLPVSVDVETDEKDGFVGIGMCFLPHQVFYFTDLARARLLIEGNKVFGHSFKFDWHMLQKWGINVAPDNVVFDTLLASYVVNPTKDKHSLKTTAHELLGYEWPTYRDMVGSGAKRRTLDKHPVEDVARYCGMDALATYRLYLYYKDKLTTQQNHQLMDVELPLMKLLFWMENKGVKIDRGYLQRMGEQLVSETNGLKQLIPCNPDSPKQVKELLQAEGLAIQATGKRDLQGFEAHPMVQLLHEYREKSKLLGTYIEPLLEKSKDDSTIRCTFNQARRDSSGDSIGISTGRLSSNSPNLQNIPARTELGQKIRRSFVPREGHTFLVADYSQIEMRIAAHFSKEPVLIEAFNKGDDVHEQTAKKMSVDRQLAKTLNFATLYGANAKRIASTLDVSVEVAQSHLDTYWRSLPVLGAWVQTTHAMASKMGGVTTVGGRYIPIPGFASDDTYVRWRAERQSVNYVIQGSAADIIKKAMLELQAIGMSPINQVHDELMFEVNPNPEIRNDWARKVREVMCGVFKLLIPLEVTMGWGSNWQESKDNGH